MKLFRLFYVLVSRQCFEHLRCGSVPHTWRLHSGSLEPGNKQCSGDKWQLTSYACIKELKPWIVNFCFIQKLWFLKDKLRLIKHSDFSWWRNKMKYASSERHISHTFSQPPLYTHLKAPVFRYMQISFAVSVEWGFVAAYKIYLALEQLQDSETILLRRKGM